MRAFFLLALLCVGCNASTPAKTISVTGIVNGVAAAGVTMVLTGAGTRTGTTDASGHITFVGLADGNYTLTPSSVSLSFLPQHVDFIPDGFDKGALFPATPPSLPFNVKIAGDAASGVGAGTFSGNNGSIPNPDVVIYDAANDLWTLDFFFDAAGTLGLGGVIQFRGTPQVQTYTQETVGLREDSVLCWSLSEPLVPNQEQHIGFWSGSTFALTFDSAAAVATDIVNESLPVTDYSVHGSLHVDCSAISDPARGNVTLDIAF